MFNVRTFEVDGYEFDLMITMGSIDGILITPDQEITVEYIEALKKAQTHCDYHYAECMLLNHGLNRNLDLPNIMKKVVEGRRLGILPPSERVDLLMRAYYNPDDYRVISGEIPRNLDGWVYLVKTANGQCKIGRTSNLPVRIKALSASHPENLELVHSIQSTNMFELEAGLHSHFDSKRIKGEWFHLSPDDIEYIKGL
jgi:hypothetical protein